MAHTCRFTTVACVAVLLLVGGLAGRSGEGGMRTPRLLREGQIDTSSVESIIKGIIKPGMSQKQKAMAVYKFLIKVGWHWGPAREGPNKKSYDYGVVYDPIKLINVYGYGYCFQNRASAEALWEAAGLEARSAGISGHSIAEVFYDGAWHFLDTDQRGYCLLPDGKTIASIDQVCRDPLGLIINQKNPSKPFFPYTRDPKVPYESKYLAASYFATTRDNYYQHDKIVLGHRMNVTLLPGMKLTRFFKGDGRWNIKNSTVSFEYKIGYLDPRKGPADFVRGDGYGSGELLYQPDLTTRSEEYAAGVWQDANIKVGKKGLEPAEAGKAAWSVFRIRLPWVISGWATAYAGPARPAGAAVVSAELYRKNVDVQQAIEVSTDRGKTWKNVWAPEDGAKTRHRVVIDLSEHVHAEYEYLLRVKLCGEKGGEARLEKLAISTGFQHNPRVYPALKPGANKMNFFLGDGTRTLEINPSLKSAGAFLKDVHSYKGIWFRRGQITGKLGQTGEVVFELKPPQAGTCVSFHAGGGLRREPYGLNARDDIKIYYAENQPKDWKLVYDDEFPKWASHWCYHGNGGAKLTPGTKKVYVKFTVRTVSSASIQRIRLYLNWKPDGAEAMPKRGMRVTHGWTEGKRARDFDRVIKKAPYEYVVKTGKDVANSYLVMEPVRKRGLKWRKDDPPVNKPPLPADKVLDEGLRDELRGMLKAIDADPKTGMPKATKSKVKWLAGNARAARSMLRTKYPIAPGKPKATPNPLADAAGEAAAKKIMAGTDSYAKLKLIAAIRAAGVRPVPDVVLQGMKSTSRYVRLETILFVRRAPSEAGITALQKAAKDDPLEFLREEARYALAAIKKTRE
jgi:hypothetical protein